LSTETAGEEIRQFVKEYVKFRKGEMKGEDKEVFTVLYPDQDNLCKYTYQPAVAREKNVPLITSGSPVFQQILKECLENGAPCQVQVKPKESMERLIRQYFKDVEFDCPNCYEISKETVSVCMKTRVCKHKINNGKILSVEIGKIESLRFFLFYYSATFHNKLRPKNEEIIPILIDENGNIVSAEEFQEEALLSNSSVELQDVKGKIRPERFRYLKTTAYEKLKTIIQQKVLLYDLSLGNEKKTRLRSFNKRLRRERREHVISKKHDFDYVTWQSNYEALLRREEEALRTNVTARFVNLLVINTDKIKFEVKLDNKATITNSFTLGINQPHEVTCPICHSAFIEGYATEDGLYVCGNCIRQSVDSWKIYSKKAILALDEKLDEYIERDSGFVCAVCGKKHSKLLEFKCNHDNSSVCIYHYGTCDICGKIFSKLNLTYTAEFQRQLCPRHTKGKETKG
jgi:hypothetical protein